tara:strand:+ start:149 stop:2371 length:2223 start_codon:yes stop_codon:yes gene_type:complete
MENQEIVELSEKDIRKKIEKIMKKKTSENISAHFEEKRAAMSLLGFGNNSLAESLFPNQKVEFPEIKDKRFIGDTLMQLSSEMITSQHIDLDLLQEIVKVQNNIEDNNMPLSDEVKEILIEDKVLESVEGLKRENNLKRLKANIEEGRIDEDQEWIQLLKSNTDYSQIKLNEEEQANFVSQNPSNKPALAEVSEKPEYKSEKQIPVVQKDIQEYWRERYIQKMNEYGLTEVHMDQYLKQANRKYKDNKYAAKLYDAYDWLLDKTVYPFKEVSISKLDDNYNIPTYSLFKESRFGKGVKFNQLPEPGHDMAYELAALKVRESGIQKPYVYATKPTSNQDLIQKNRFIENQINALIEYADYDINDIDVPHQFKPILEKIKKEQEMKQAMVLDQEELLQKVVNGNTNKSEREMFLDKINVTENINGELVSKNFDMNNPNDVLLLQKISEGSKIEDKGESENNLLNLLKEKFKFAQNYKPENPSPSFQNVDSVKEENKKPVNNSESEDDQLVNKSITLEENEILSKEKALINFNDYNGVQTDPETKINEELEAILSLKKKLDNPEVSEQIDKQQRDLIIRKGTIIETFRNNPELDDDEKKVIVKLLGKGDVRKNWDELTMEAMEMGAYNTAIEKHGLTELDSTVKKLLGKVENNNKPNAPKPENKKEEKSQNKNQAEVYYDNEIDEINDQIDEESLPLPNNDYDTSYEAPENVKIENSKEPEKPLSLEENKRGNTNKSIKRKPK